MGAAWPRLDHIVELYNSVLTDLLPVEEPFSLGSPSFLPSSLLSPGALAGGSDPEDGYRLGPEPRDFGRLHYRSDRSVIRDPATESRHPDSRNSSGREKIGSLTSLPEP